MIHTSMIVGIMKSVFEFQSLLVTITLEQL